MFSICLRYTKNKTEAEEAFQQGFYLVFKNIRQLKTPDRLSGWIKRIFVNTALDQIRKSSHLQVVEADDKLFNNTLYDANEAINTIAVEELTQLIQNLPAGCRSVFNLYVIDGLSHKEIAKHLKVSVGTSKSQLHDARKILKEKVIKNNLIKQTKAIS